MKLLLRLLITAAVAYGLAKVLDGIDVADFWTAFVFAVVLALLNVIVKPILIILTLPVTLITLGLFLFVINTIVVLLASKLVDGFSIANFWWGLLFALLLSIINTFIGRELDKEDRKKII
jgi:putative membrane protein